MVTLTTHRCKHSVKLFVALQRNRQAERERKAEGNRRRKMKTRKRKSIQGFIVADHAQMAKCLLFSQRKHC